MFNLKAKVQIIWRNGKIIFEPIVLQGYASKRHRLKRDALNLWGHTSGCKICMHNNNHTPYHTSAWVLIGVVLLEMLPTLHPAGAPKGFNIIPLPVFKQGSA